MRELEHFLPDLAPPPGGLGRLQRSVATRYSRPRHHRLKWAFASVVCAALVALAVGVPRWIIQGRRSDALHEAVRIAIEPSTSAGGIHVMHGAAIELPSVQSNVRLYLVASVPSASREP